MGASMGGNYAFQAILSALPATFPLPIVVVIHQPPSPYALLTISLQLHCKLKVQEAEDGKRLQAGCVYLASPNYHLLIEPDKTFAFSTEAKVHYARPAIDPLFMSAAEVYREGVIGVLLTGTNQDGTDGLRQIQAYGGCTIAQTLATAEFPFMPQHAIEAGVVEHVLPLADISTFLCQFM